MVKSRISRRKQRKKLRKTRKRRGQKRQKGGSNYGVSNSTKPQKLAEIQIESSLNVEDKVHSKAMNVNSPVNIKPTAEILTIDSKRKINLGFLYNNKSKRDELLKHYANRNIMMHNNLLRHRHSNITSKFNNYKKVFKKRFTPKNSPIVKHITMKNIRNLSSIDYLKKSTKKFEELELDFIRLYLLFEDKKMHMSRNHQNTFFSNGNDEKKRTTFKSFYSMEGKAAFQIISRLVNTRLKTHTQNVSIELNIYQLKNYVDLLKKINPDNYHEINAIYEGLKNISLLMYKLLSYMLKYYKEINSVGMISDSNMRFKKTIPLLNAFQQLNNHS